ncbi:LapA family protein, partial [Ralstonia insidiosa]|nr:LapA family protein [Ralstonia insidiosa]
MDTSNENKITIIAVIVAIIVGVVLQIVFKLPLIVS